jgi:polysaccharide deacetylase 2 family uncharacterized protein YibQ
MRGLKMRRGHPSWWHAVGLGLVAAGAGWMALGGEGGVRYRDVARVELPLPTAETRTSIAPEPPLPAAETRTSIAPEPPLPAAETRGSIVPEPPLPAAETRTSIAPEPPLPAAETRTSIAPEPSLPAAETRTPIAPDSPFPAAETWSPVAPDRPLPAVEMQAAAAPDPPLPAAETRAAVALAPRQSGRAPEPGTARDTKDTAAAAVDLSLVEPGPFGPLPRIGPDGRRPLFAYAQPFDFSDRRPKVAVIILGLGLRADLFDAALALPGPVGLQLSPYARDLPALVERARRAGHEVLLDLPMEPADYPASDPGPHTLLADNSREENLERLDWVLSRASGYAALAGAGGRFAGSDQAAAVLNVLARRGLALIEVGAGQLEGAAAAAGLPYASAPHALDQDPSAPAIDRALGGLEAAALAGGSALGLAQDYPVSLERLRLWLKTLADKGLVLAPVSAVLIEQSGLTRGTSAWPAHRRPA